MGPTGVRSAWSMWTCAFLFMSAFAVRLLISWIEMGWFDAEVVTNVPFGVAAVAVSPAGVAIGIALLAASHLVRRLLPRRRIAPRVALDLGDDGSYRSAPTATTATLNAAQLHAAEIARRHVGLAWSLVFSLAIAGVGFWAPRGVGFHGPRQHPMEWWVFFAASLVAVASHAPIGTTKGGRRFRSSGPIRRPSLRGRRRGLHRARDRASAPDLVASIPCAIRLR